MLQIVIIGIYCSISGVYFLRCANLKPGGPRSESLPIYAGTLDTPVPTRSLPLTSYIYSYNYIVFVYIYIGNSAQRPEMSLFEFSPPG